MWGPELISILAHTHATISMQRLLLLLLLVTAPPRADTAWTNWATSVQTRAPSNWWYTRWSDACIAGTGDTSLRLPCAINSSVATVGQFYNATQKKCSTCTARTCKTGEYLSTCKQPDPYTGAETCDVAPANKLTIAEGFTLVAGTAAYTNAGSTATLVAVLDRSR